MRMLALMISIVGCSNGDGAKSAREPAPAAESAPAAPPPKTAEAKPDQVAIASDPCDGGEIASDPCDGGEVTRVMGSRGRSSGAATSALADEKKSNVIVGAADVQGSLDADAMVRIVRQHTAKLSRCYAQHLKRDPNPVPGLVLEFTIAADGKVTAARATGGAPAELAACLVAAMKTMVFPAPGAVVTVKFPLTLAPAS